MALAACHAPSLRAQQIAAQNPASPPQAPAAQLQLRVYEGFNTPGPAAGYQGTPLAVDVGVGLAKCPDGNTEISVMNIGGWRFDAAGSCGGDNQRGSIQVWNTPPPSAGTAAATGAATGAHVIRCDPATWRCAPATR